MRATSTVDLVQSKRRLKKPPRDPSRFAHGGTAVSYSRACGKPRGGSFARCDRGWQARLRQGAGRRGLEPGWLADRGHHPDGRAVGPDGDGAVVVGAPDGGPGGFVAL